MQGESFTKLIDKHYSSLVMRRYTRWGWPLIVAIITDNNLETLDDVVVRFMEENKKEGWVNNIQKLRNLAGGLSEQLTESFDRTEGVGIVFSVDKSLIVSLWGDFMVHTSCRIEFFGLLNLSAHV